MKGFDESWTSAEAVQALFFPDLSSNRADVERPRMRQLISMAFEGMDLQSTALSSLQQKTILLAVQAIKTTMPHLGAKSVMHAMLWARWAVQSPDLPIPSAFWQQLAFWRAGKKPALIRLMQYRDPKTKTWRGKTRTVPGTNKLVGYTLDQVLSHKNFSFNEYSAQWRIRSVQFAGVVKRRASSRDVENVCGQKTVQLLSECIRVEAATGVLGILSREMIQGKYTSTVSPAELVERLKIQHPELAHYSSSTLIRGLSAFVRCPRGRPGGRQPPKPQGTGAL